MLGVGCWFETLTSPASTKILFTSHGHTSDVDRSQIHPLDVNGIICASRVRTYNESTSTERCWAYISTPAAPFLFFLNLLGSPWANRDFSRRLVSCAPTPVTSWTSWVNFVAALPSTAPPKSCPWLSPGVGTYRFSVVTIAGNSSHWLASHR